MTSRRVAFAVLIIVAVVVLGRSALGGGNLTPPSIASAVTPLRPPPPGTPTTVSSPPIRPPTTLPPTTLPPASVPLASGWRLLRDPGDVGLSQGWFRGGATNLSWTPVTIPDDFNPLISRGGAHELAAWYEVRFKGPPTPAGRSWLVSFESVRRHALVWLNGTLIGSSEDPYAPFSLPARTLRPNAPNVLVVRADNLKGAGSLPEDWWNWGGIMGPVALEPAGRLALVNSGVMPELGCAYRCGDLLVQGTVANRSLSALRPQLLLSIVAPGGVTTLIRQRLPQLAPGAAIPVSFRAPVSQPLALWSPQSPALYRVQALVIAQGRVEQQETFRVGMRSVQVRGGILYLNGARLWLHGAAIHEDVAGRGAALSDGDIDTLVSNLRSVGANVTRAHYQLSPRLLDALDAAGIMVWEEPPVEHADQLLGAVPGRMQALALLRSTILAARNHPSVIVDSVGNELSPTPDTTPGTNAYLSQAATLARQLNPTVPVGLDIYCYPGFPAQRLYSRLDLLGISDYFGWYSGLPGHSIADFSGLGPYLAQTHARYPRQALVVSEFGAESLFDGPALTKGSYEFQSDYLRRTLGVLDRLPFLSGSIYWTLREFAVGPGWRGGATLPPGSAPDGIHHKGLIAYDGAPKPAFALAAQLFARQPSFVAR